MKRRTLATALAALLSLGVVACEGGTATDDATIDPGADPLDGATLDDGTLDGGTLDGGAGTEEPGG